MKLQHWRVSQGTNVCKAAPIKEFPQILRAQHGSNFVEMEGGPALSFSMLLVRDI